MNSKKYIGIIASSVAVMALAFVVATPTFAATNTQLATGNGWGKGDMMRGGMNGMKPAVVGQVTAITGNNITIASRGFGKTTATTTYTVDATNAIVMKNNATSMVFAIAVGDRLFVQGTVTGTHVTATMIRDGMGMMKPRANPAANFQGNGEPVVAGSVASVSGSTLTVTNSGNLTYTVDATNAKITRVGTTNATISNVAVGDQVIVQGTVNGTSVVATSVIDHPHLTTGTGAQTHQGGGFFSGVEQFFMKLFHF